MNPPPKEDVRTRITAHHQIRGLALIPVFASRSPTRLPALDDLGGVPLLWWTVAAAKEAAHVAAVLVVTDSEDVAEFCHSRGIHTMPVAADKIVSDARSTALSRELQENPEWGTFFRRERVMLRWQMPFRSPQCIDRVLEAASRTGMRSRLVHFDTFYPGMWYRQTLCGFNPVSGFRCQPVLRGQKSATAYPPLDTVSRYTSSLSALIRNFPQSKAGGKELLSINKVLRSLTNGANRVEEKYLHHLPVINRFKLAHVVSTTCPHMQTAISTNDDLRCANRMLTQCLLQWYPKGVPSEGSRESCSHVSARGEVTAIGAQPVQLSSVDGCIIAYRSLDSLMSPLLLRRYLDELTACHGISIVISRNGCTLKGPVDRGEPIIALHRHSRLGKAVVGLNEVASGISLSGARGEKNTQDIQPISVLLHDGSLLVRLSSAARCFDQLRVFLFDFCFRALEGAAYYFDGAIWHPHLTFRGVCVHPNGSEKVLQLKGLPSKAAHASVQWLRQGHPHSQKPVVFDGLMPDFDSLKDTPSVDLSLATAPAPIDKEGPNIFEWAGWAYLPAQCSSRRQWRAWFPELQEAL